MEFDKDRVNKIRPSEQQLIEKEKNETLLTKA